MNQLMVHYNIPESLKSFKWDLRKMHFAASQQVSKPVSQYAKMYKLHFIRSLKIKLFYLPHWITFQDFIEFFHGNFSI